MLNPVLSASWAASVPTAPSGSAFSPRTTKMTMPTTAQMAAVVT
jgi:hypothetical protein